MGLHESILNVPERLRIWHQAGVRHFFLSPRETPPAQTEPDCAPTGDPGDDPSAWPEPWATYFAKAPASPKIVITYAELGLDMSGQGDSRRGGIWRKLIAALGLSGRHAVAFWPMALPESGVSAPNESMFLAGLKRLNPDVLAVFGAKAAAWHAEMAPRLGTVTCVMLPDPGTLLGDDKEAWHHVLEQLDGG